MSRLIEGRAENPIVTYTFATDRSRKMRLPDRLRRVIRRACPAGLFSEAILIVCGQAAAAAGGIVGVPLLAHSMRPEDYGSLALGGTVATLVQQVSLGPIGNAAQRFYAASIEANTLQSYLRAMARVVVAASATIALLGGLAWVGLALSAWRHSAALAGWSMGFAILSGVSSVLDGIQTAARQRAIVAWHQGLGMWLRFGIAAIFVRRFGGAAMAMSGFTAAAGVVLVSQAFFLRRAVSVSQSCSRPVDSDVERTLRRKLWIYARPFSSWGIFTWAQVASDRWALESFANTRSVGLYQVLYQFGYYPISLVSVFLMQLAQPILFKRAGSCEDEARMKGAYAIIRRLFVATLSASVAATVIAALAGGRLFHLLLPSAYGSVARYLPLMVLSSGIFACGQIASLKHGLSMDPRSLIAPKIATALLGACLNFAGAFAFGVAGVAWASVTFSATYCLWVLLASASPGPIAGSAGNEAATV